MIEGGSGGEALLAAGGVAVVVDAALRCLSKLSEHRCEMAESGSKLHSTLVDRAVRQ